MTDRATLGSWDLVDRDGKTPKDWTLEIARVERRLVKSREKPDGEHKPHISFRGATKPLVAGSTVCETISDIAGSEDTDRWIGLKITLYQARVRGKKGKACQGIRVRPLKATGAPEEMGDGRAVDERVRAEQEAAMGDEADHGGAA